MSEMTASRIDRRAFSKSDVGGCGRGGISDARFGARRRAARRRHRRRLWRRELRARAAQDRPAHRGDAGRGQHDLHRAAHEQRRDRRLARARAAAIRLRRDQPRPALTSCSRPRRRSIRRTRQVTLADGKTLTYDRLVSRARHRFPLGRDPRLRPRRGSRSCRTPGTTARRSRCCAASSKRWTTAARS